MKFFKFGIPLMVVLVVAVFAIFTFSKNTDLKQNANLTSDTQKTGAYAGKKILFIDSYHKGYAWSDSVQEGSDSLLLNTGAVLKKVYMDTNRNTDEAFIQNRALDVKKQIDEFAPDVIISADDAALKYVIMPYFKNSEIPVVYCGINWDSSPYGTPYTNMTGMIEVSLIPGLLEHIKDYAKGSRIGWLGGDVLTNRKEPVFIKKLYNIEMVESYPKTMAEFKTAFLDLQDQVDLILFYSTAGIQDWDELSAQKFIYENIKVPIGATLDFMKKVSVVDYAKVGQEQGEYAAKTALRILDGTAPSSIAEVKNTKGTLFVNLDYANKLGIQLRGSLLKNAQVVRIDTK